MPSAIRYKDIFNTTINGVLVTDASGQLTHINRQAEKILGFSARRHIGCYISDLLPLTGPQVMACIESGVPNLGHLIKGKVVDLLTDKADAVVRFQGGHNAGHTLVVEDKKVIVHLLPSGVVHRGKVCALGAGMVIVGATGVPRFGTELTGESLRPLAEAIHDLRKSETEKTEKQGDTKETLSDAEAADAQGTAGHGCFLLLRFLVT